VLCGLFPVCRGKGLKVANISSQGIFKADTMELVKQAALVSYGIELPDLYCDLVLAGKLRFREAARVYMSCLTEYKMESKAVH